MSDRFPEFARARMDRMTAVRFHLDHDNKTARVEKFFGSFGTHSKPFQGVHSEIEPFATIQRPDELVGKSLRLMGHPFCTKVVYQIVEACVVLPNLRNPQTGTPSRDEETPRETGREE